MQTCSILLLILFFSMSPELRAEVNIIDETRVLETLPFYNKTPFEKAFRCNQSQEFFIQVGKCQISCDETICKDNCLNMNSAPVQMQVEECTNDSVQIYTSAGQAITALRSDYEQSSQSIARTMLKQLDFYYEPVHHIKVIRSTPLFGSKLIENGKMTQLKTVKILFQVFSQEELKDSALDSSEYFEMELDLNRTGLDQLMFLYPDMDFSGKSGYVIKRKGLIHAEF